MSGEGGQLSGGKATRGARRRGRGAVKVAVVGGGIAGISAALQIARTPGHRVTLYEQNAELGGNLGSRTLPGAGAEGSFGPVPSLPLDVYPHMFQGWYENFWALLRSTPQAVSEGRDWRADHFTPFDSFSQARPRARKKNGKRGESHVATLRLPYSPASLLENLFSGVASPADMFVFGYASLDLQAEAVDRTERLRNLSLTGYLSSRRYMTDAALDAYEAFILRVWGVPAYMISAADCRAYGACCYGAADEPTWLSNEPASRTIVEPLREALADAKVDVICDCALVKVVVGESPVSASVRARAAAIAAAEQARAGELTEGAEAQASRTFRVESLEFAGGQVREDFDYVVLAVPAPVLWKLVIGEGQKRGERIIDAREGLSGLQRIATQRLPMLYVAFEPKLPEVPDDPVALYGSRLNLAFTDLSQRWRVKQFRNRTVLAVSCSEPLRLIGPGAGDDALAMLGELSEYLDFEAPTRTAEIGRKPSHVRWARFESNEDAQISLNVVGSDAWRPRPLSPSLPNLLLAGDYCQHDFGITTVEGAVATGLAAASALLQLSTGDPDLVEIIPPKTMPPAAFLAMRYAWLPAAYAAMGVSRVSESVSEEWNPSEPQPGESLLPYLLTPGLKARKA